MTLWLMTLVDTTIEILTLEILQSAPNNTKLTLHLVLLEIIHILEYHIDSHIKMSRYDTF